MRSHRTVVLRCTGNWRPEASQMQCYGWPMIGYAIGHSYKNTRTDWHQNTHQQVKAKILERMGEWSEMFSRDPDLGIMEQAYTKLKSQSTSFMHLSCDECYLLGVRS